MGDLLRIAVGPTLSLLFFFIGYRRTVGARKERAHAAEFEIERLMVRRVIVDQYTPTWDDLSRLVSRKARQQRVKVTDLASEGQLLTAIYTEILENEFVAHSDREKLLQRIDGVIRARELSAGLSESLETAVESEDLSADRVAVQRQRQRLLVAMGALAAAGGTGAAALSTVGASGVSAPEILPIVAAVSAALVTLAGLVVSQRERLDEDGEPAPGRAAVFETKVTDAVQRAGFNFLPAEDPGSSIPFRLETDAGRIGVVVSYVSDVTTTRVRSLIRSSLRDAGRFERFDELVLVLPSVPPALRQWSADDQVHVLDLRGFRTYLERIKKLPPIQARDPASPQDSVT